jgi:hypothetical protein
MRLTALLMISMLWAVACGTRHAGNGNRDRPCSALASPSDLALPDSGLLPDTSIDTIRSPDLFFLPDVHADPDMKVDTGEPDFLPPDSGQRCVTEQIPKDDGTKREVVFEFHYKGSKPVWVAAQAQWCAPYKVSIGSLPLLLEHPHTVECEGPAPPNGYVTTAVALHGKSKSPELTWNTKYVVRYKVCVDCSHWGPGTQEPQPFLRSASINVAPGTYQATFGIYDGIPKNCVKRTGSEDLFCREDYSGAFSDGKTCAMPGRGVSVTFTIPKAAGTTRVKVDVPVAAP